MNSVEVRDFLNYVRSERALSENTRDAYEQDLEQFLEFCERRTIDPVNASLKDLRDFLASLRKRDLSQRSLARKTSALKQFFKFLLREGRIDKNPSELLQVIIKGKKLPKHLSVKEIFGLIAAAEGVTESEIRDRAMLETWYATGARVSELGSLRIDSIDWKDGLVKVLGKGEGNGSFPCIGRR